MNGDIKNTILTFALGFFVVLDVLFAVRAMTGERAFRNLQLQAGQSQNYLVQVQQFQLLVNDVRQYDQQHPSAELKRLLNLLQTKPATR